MIIGRHTDSKGRSTGERVTAVRRATATTDAEHAAATHLLDVLLDAASLQGVNLDDFDWVADLPGACLDVIKHRDRNNDTKAAKEG